jgi:16S rRNA (cytosine1407-C5)-methyltransferase
MASGSCFVVTHGEAPAMVLVLASLSSAFPGPCSDQMPCASTDDLPIAALERYRTLINDWPAFIESLSRPLPSCVWTNTQRITPAALRDLLADDGITATELPWLEGGLRLEGVERIGERWWYLAGLCHAQEEASLFPVRLLAPRPGERVLDLCAAPGGKSAQIATAIGESGTLIANDVSGERIRGLRANPERLGLLNVSTTRRDGTGFANAAGWFDRVLVDAPCSAEGTLRRQGRSLGTHSTQGPGRYAGRQLALLRRAVALCRPGGRIVYSTCTFAPEENELVIDTLLRETDPWVRIARVENAALRTGHGVTHWQGRRLHEELHAAHRVWPHQNDTGGFFAVPLDKDPQAPGEPSAPPDRVTPIPAPELESAVLDRFGVDPTVLDRWPAVRRSGRGLYVTSQAHRPGKRPIPETSGLRLLRS